MHYTYGCVFIKILKSQMSVYAVSSEIYRFFKVFMQHVECFLFGIMLTIKCFQFLVLRNKVKKTDKQKKRRKKPNFLQLCDQALW
jgi:predicted histidine transporter YuiF (NhaC family)